MTTMAANYDSNEERQKVERYFAKTNIVRTGKSYTNEKGMQKVFCKWVKDYYPNALFQSNLSGESFTMSAAIINKACQSHNGAPDFLCFEQKGNFVGLALELKMDNINIVGKGLYSGYASEHLMKQRHYLYMLERRDWFTSFAIGLDEAKHIFSEYMNLK